MTIQIDSREKPQARERIQNQFIQRGVKFYVSKMWVGDYGSLDNARLAIDRKQNLSEVCSNLCQQHERFRAECVRAQEADIRLIFLVEHGRGIESLEDVKRWQNPRRKTSPKATNGEQLAKAMQTMAERYGIEWLFCDPAVTGFEIVRLLDNGKEGV
jgi:hypothetical protein